MDERTPSTLRDPGPHRAPGGTERGQIEIEYYNETDLERLLEILGVL